MPLNFKIISTRIFPTQEKVADLLDCNDQWNEALIYNSFLEFEARIILSIHWPTSLAHEQSNRDMYYWHYVKRGEYIVKSTYVLGTDICDPEAPSSTNSTVASCSNKFWAASLPPKFKIF